MTSLVLRYTPKRVPRTKAELADIYLTESNAIETDRKKSRERKCDDDEATKNCYGSLISDRRKVLNMWFETMRNKIEKTTNKMSIAEILKGCLRGTRLYSPIYGELSLESICSHNSIYPIICRVSKSGNAVSFTEDGKMNTNDAEPTLFPSKKQRDWNKFNVNDQVAAQETKPQFKPFDKVLVRDIDENEWECDLFSHIDEEDYYVCVGSWWLQCIPYEGNEHLLGTKNKP